MDFFCPMKGTSLSGFSSFIFVSMLSDEFLKLCYFSLSVFFLGGWDCLMSCVRVSASEPSLFTFARNRGGAVKGFFFFGGNYINFTLFFNIWELF